MSGRLPVLLSLKAATYNSEQQTNIKTDYSEFDRLCGLEVRVPGCRHRGLGFHYRRYQIIWIAACLERGILSLVRINEELLKREGKSFGLENKD
jgi:hypothetical protein